MTRSLFRGFLFGCFALLAAVFTISSPAPASADPLLQTHELHMLHVGDLVTVAPEAVAHAVKSEVEAPDARLSVDTGPIAPVYLLSYRTFGQNLARHHLRC